MQAKTVADDEPKASGERKQRVIVDADSSQSVITLRNLRTEQGHAVSVELQCTVGCTR